MSSTQPAASGAGGSQQQGDLRPAFSPGLIAHLMTGQWTPPHARELFASGQGLLAAARSGIADNAPPKTLDKMAAGHTNTALLFVYDQGGVQQYAGKAFSNSSTIRHADELGLAAAVPQDRQFTTGVPQGTIRANHTEPKLFLEWRNSEPRYDPALFILFSELDCCSSCIMHTLREMELLTSMLALDGAQPAAICIVVEVNSGNVLTMADVVERAEADDPHA